MTRRYYRPLLQHGPRASGSYALGEGPFWFTHLEVLERDIVPDVISATAMFVENFGRVHPSPLVSARPTIMGILNVTPDSFSDGGQYDTVQSAVEQAQRMVQDGAHMLDIGGESTRPGAEPVDVDEEIARTAPVIAAIRAKGITQPISIDTRKAQVAEAALDAGADIVNDVSGLTYDPDLVTLCAERQVQVCVMHMTGDPATMHLDPRYDDVLLDVYDHLAERISALQHAGILPQNIILDPGIGFAKTLEHNLALLNRISLFHALGAPILLGVSRKRFIGTIGNAPQAVNRVPGSIAVALAALAQGVQILRVHDVADTAQAVALWQAVQSGEFDG